MLIDAHQQDEHLTEVHQTLENTYYVIYQKIDLGHCINHHRTHFSTRKKAIEASKHYVTTKRIIT